jgi:putative sigma-54 modulation protein
LQIEYTGRHTEITPALRDLAEKKLGKLDKTLRGGITHAHVILSVSKHREIAEVTVHFSHSDLTATFESGDLATSLAEAIDKLARQAQKHRGKLRERKRRAGGRGLPTPAPADGENGGRVVRSRRFVAKPMTMDEAVLEVASNADGLLVFRDASTERLNVLYRRKDGNLGLIEPER